MSRPDRRLARSQVHSFARHTARAQVERHVEGALIPALRQALRQLLADGILTSIDLDPAAPATPDVHLTEQLWPYRVHLRIALEDLDPPPPPPSVATGPAVPLDGPLPAAYVAALMALAHGAEGRAWGGTAVLVDREDPNDPGFTLWSGQLWVLEGLAQRGLADVEIKRHSGERLYRASQAGIELARNRLQQPTT